MPKKKPKTKEFWLTTRPDPRSRDTGVDAGQRGWRTHVVKCNADDKIRQVRARAACGLLPTHGWGMDLFITRRCARCVQALAARSETVRGSER